MAWVALPDLAQGLNLDASPEEVPPGTATGGTNVRYRSGYAERMRGISSVFTPAIAPYGLAHYTVNTTRYMVYPGLAKTYVYDGTTETEITNASNTGAVDNKWSCFQFNGLYVQNNGVDKPEYWTGDTAANLATLTGWDVNERAAWMAPFKNWIFAGDITKTTTRYRQLLKTSRSAIDAGALPTSWDETDPTLDAVEQPFAQTNGSLVTGLAFGDDLFCIYKEDAILYAQPADALNVFRFGRFPGDTGALAHNCVVEVAGIGHIVFTPGFDLIFHNGQGPQSILTGRMRSWLAANINQEQATRSFLAKNTATDEVLLCFPYGASATTCNMALVWNWKDNTFALRELSNVTCGSLGQVSLTNSEAWSADSAAWSADTTSWSALDYAPNSPRLILGRTTPQLCMFDASSQDYGGDYASTAEWGGMHFDSPERMKRIDGLRMRFEGAQGTVIYVQCGSSRAPDASVLWGDVVTHTIGTSTYVPASCEMGYFLWARAYSTSGPTWRVRGGQANVIPGGYF